MVCERVPVLTRALARAHSAKRLSHAVLFAFARACCRAVDAAARVFVRRTPFQLGMLQRGYDTKMPSRLHFDRSAAHQCHWHTGCNKRFSSKRQLHRHLEQEHGLRRDAERGWRATGVGARGRRRERREGQPAQPRSPQERGATMLQSPYTASYSPSRVSFGPTAALAGDAAADCFVLDTEGARSAVPSSVDGVQPFNRFGREAAMGSVPARSSAAMPPPFSAPAVMPPSGSRGSSTTAERPSCSAEKPPASSAARPPFTTCDEGARAVAFGVSPRPVPDRSPAGPCGDVNDDPLFPSMGHSVPRWNKWTRNSVVDAAKVKF